MTYVPTYRHESTAEHRCGMILSVSQEGSADVECGRPAAWVYDHWLYICEECHALESDEDKERIERLELRRQPASPNREDPGT